MIHIVTHYIPRRVLSDIWWPMARDHNRDWAEKLGWNFVADSKQRLVHDDNGPLPKGMMVYREKSAILADKIQEMQDGDLCLWMDGDAVIVQDPSGIWDNLGDADVAMSKFKAGRWNGGVVPFVVNERTRELWPDCATHKHTSGKHFVDLSTGDKIGKWLNHRPLEDVKGRPVHAIDPCQNPNTCDSCPREPGDRTPLCDNEHLRVVELDRRYNEHFDRKNKDTRIIGLHMMSMSRTLRLMKEAIAWQPS